MSLLDILGNYYDSASEQYSKVPEVLNFTVNVAVGEIRSGGIMWNARAIHDGKEYSVDANYGGLFKTCNDIAPNFFVNKRLRSNDNPGEQFQIDAIVGGKKFSLRSNDQATHIQFLDKWLKEKSFIPKKMSMAFTITRERNKEFRKKVALHACGGKTPKDYFAEVCSVSFNNTNIPKSKWGVKRAFKRGTIKYYICNQYTKQDCVFLAEYLYGVKIPKNATYEEFFKRLANRAQTDFGIKDVQLLKKMVEVVGCRNSNPSRVAEHLLKIGVKPATNLKRWYKHNPEMEKLLINS